MSLTDYPTFSPEELRTEAHYIGFLGLWSPYCTFTTPYTCRSLRVSLPVDVTQISSTTALHREG